MSTARISVNIDENIKQSAQRILAKSGMNMTTAIDLLLRTIVREERVPFDLYTKRPSIDAELRNYINSELDKSMLEAADPNVRKLSHDEMMAHLKQQREARRNV